MKRDQEWEGRVVWVCSCGCTTGWRHENGDFECANCSQIVCEDCAGSWRYHLPEPPVDVPITQSGDFKIVDFGSHIVALRRLLRIGGERVNEIAGLVILYANGTHSSWFPGSMGKDQNTWAKKQLDIVKEEIDGPEKEKLDQGAS